MISTKRPCTLLERTKTEENKPIDHGFCRSPGPGCCSWPSPVGRAVRACGDIVGAGWIAWRGREGSGPGRADITGSREGAKPRSREVPMKRIIFRQNPRAASVEPFLGKGHPGPQPSSARRARLPGKRSGSGGRSGLRARWRTPPVWAVFWGAGLGK